jgi:hypothetical protein
MKTIYAVWHQAEGVVTSHLFVEPPTDEQMIALRAELARRHNRPDMEMRVRPILLLEPDEVPWSHLHEPASDGDGQASVDQTFTVSGEGTIE